MDTNLPTTSYRFYAKCHTIFDYIGRPIHPLTFTNQKGSLAPNGGIFMQYNFIKLPLPDHEVSPHFSPALIILSTLANIERTFFAVRIRLISRYIYRDNQSGLHFSNPINQIRKDTRDRVFPPSTLYRPSQDPGGLAFPSPEV